MFSCAWLHSIYRAWQERVRLSCGGFVKTLVTVCVNAWVPLRLGKVCVCVCVCVCHLAPSQQGARHTQQLPLPYREVLPILNHLRIQLQGQLRHLGEWSQS